MRKLLCMLAMLLIYASTEAVCRQLSDDIVNSVGQVLESIYQISAQELQEHIGLFFPNIPTVGAEQLFQRMENEPNLLVINVLPAKHYDDCHIDGSINAPLTDLISLASNWDRDRQIVVYCALAECDASQKAYVLLKCLGFVNVIDYEGGIQEWYQLGLPTAGPCVHSYLQSRACPCQKPKPKAYISVRGCGCSQPKPKPNCSKPQCSMDEGVECDFEAMLESTSFVEMLCRMARR